MVLITEDRRQSVLGKSLFRRRRKLQEDKEVDTTRSFIMFCLLQILLRRSSEEGSGGQIMQRAFLAERSNEETACESYTCMGAQC